MKIFKKKVPIGISIALAFAAGAVTYSLGYSMAMKKFNDVISYNQEKENMYSKLSEIDKTVRQEYISDIDEEALTSGICSGYVSGLKDDTCKYLTPNEYKKFISNKAFDENAVIYEAVDDGVGYIRINSITDETGNMFVNAVKNFSEQSIQRVILDIRGLSGTNLEPIGKCLDSIVQEGDLIKSVDKKGNKEVVYKANSDRLDIKFSIIVDSDTEGIPELLASACKDSGVGKVIGEKTKGNAVQQKAIALSDGSGIVYPAAHYVTQKEEIFTGKGVSPDVEIILDSDKKELLRRGELSRDDDIQFQEALKSLS